MPTPSPTIRLFVSSTFSDLKAERDALQREVFPRLKQLCLSKGLRFQAIDLRWGISEEAGRDNRTMRICLRELRRCQQDRPKPNFLILLGDRYGWRPLPEIIPTALFERLREHLTAENPKIAEILDACYQRDDNAVPPIYELQPRGDHASWHEQVEKPLLAALEGSAQALGLDLEKEGVSIGASATEQEIIEGALKVPDAATHVRAFFRTIEGLPDPAPQDYVETGEAARRLKELKDRIGKHIGAGGVWEYHVPWCAKIAPPEEEQESGVASDERTPRPPKPIGIHPDDLKDFCEQVWKRLSEIVEEQIAALVKVPPDVQEELAHQDFGKERCRRFVGRDEPLEGIAAYLRQGSGKPLAVIGSSGSGKSAVMARAVVSNQETVVSEHQAEDRGQKSEIIARYIGATPASSDLIQLLRNLVAEIRKRYPAPVVTEPASSEGGKAKPTDAEIPFEYNPLVNAFHEALKRPTADRPLFLFLDALDQLTASHNAHSLAWLPASLSPYVRLIVSAALPASTDIVAADVSPRNSHGEEVSADSRRRLPSETSDPRSTVMAALGSRLEAEQRVTLAPLTAADGELMLTNWLADACRTLQPAQRQAILQAFEVEGSPLWLRTATEEAARLASWRPAPAFAPTAPRLLGQVLARLSREEEHGEKLVSRTLSYLACARHGLAEDEILDILSADPEVMADFRRRSPNSPKVESLPVAVWVRLHGDLAFYLAEHQAQSASLLGFYHQSFLEAVTARGLASHEARRARHQHLADWFGKQAWFISPAAGESKLAQATISDPPNARKASELPWHLYHAADASDPERRQEPVWQPLADLLSNLLLVEAKVRADLVFELQDDYRLALAGLPERQTEMAVERENKAHTQRWVVDLIAYSKAWSERRARKVRGEALSEPEPQLPPPVASCRMWTDDEIQAECEHIIASPSRLDHLRAFSVFVEAECYPLLEHGIGPGFVVQHAFNSAPAGPVHIAADRLSRATNIPLLLRRWPPDPAWNSNPVVTRTLEGHSACVGSVSVTPDGRRAVSGSMDNTIKVWDLESGQCLRTLEGHSAEVRSVSVTPDGRRLVSGGDDNTIRVWDLESGQCLRTLVGYGEGITCMSVTPDGRCAVSGHWGPDNTLLVWNLEGGNCLRALKGHSEQVNSVSVTPDGRCAVSGSFDNTLRVWDLESGQCLYTLEAHSHSVNCVRVTPDGQRAVTGGDDTLRVWDLESGQCLRTLVGHSEGIICLSVTPDGRRAVSGGEDRALRVWDLGNGQCLRMLQGLPFWVLSVSVTLDGRRAVSGSDDHKVRVWNLESGQCPRAVTGARNTVIDLRLTVDGRRAVSRWHRTLQVWDVESGRCLQMLNATNTLVGPLSITPDGQCAVSGSDDHKLRIWDTESGQCLRTLEGHSAEVRSVSVTPDGRHVVSGGRDSTLRVWNLESGQCLRTIWVRHMARLLMTPDGRRAVTGSYDDTIKVWDLKSGQCLRRLLGHSGRIACMSVTLDGRRVVSGAWDQKLRVWDLETGQCTQALEDPRASPRRVSVTPDGRRAVSSSTDDTIRLWDLESGQCLRTLEGRHTEVRQVIITMDGRRAMSSGQVDNTLRVWDLESGQCLGVYAAPAEIILVVLADHGNTVCMGTGAGEVLFLDVRGIEPGPDLKPDVDLDTGDEYYEQLLRRGLEFSRREKGKGHEETLAHLAALAAHFEQLGQPEAARPFAEEHAHLISKKKAKNLREPKRASQTRKRVQTKQKPKRK